jgi:hypothetical protein
MGREVFGADKGHYRNIDRTMVMCSVGDPDPLVFGPSGVEWTEIMLENLTQNV